jgi:protein-tyrosine phosphatase
VRYVNRVGTINPIQIIHIGLIDRADQAECCKKLIGEIIPSLLQQCDKRILFHCNTGKSRSATFAVAFLSRLFSKNAMDVLEDVIRKRPIVKPNVGFMYVLQKMSN